jgi:hypothetical protein
MQGATGGTAQFVEPLLRVHPKSQVQITAFMPNLDLLAMELPKSRDLLPERLGDRADDGYGLHLGERHPRIGHDICGHPELVLALQQETVLFLDLGPLHDSLPELHEIALAAMPHLEAHDKGRLLACASQLRHPGNQLDGVCIHSAIGGCNGERPRDRTVRTVCDRDTVQRSQIEISNSVRVWVRILAARGGAGIERTVDHSLTCKNYHL